MKGSSNWRWPPDSCAVISETGGYWKLVGTSGSYKAEWMTSMFEFDVSTFVNDVDDVNSGIMARSKSISGPFPEVSLEYNGSISLRLSAQLHLIPILTTIPI